MIIWLNGAFGAGKTTVAEILRRRLPGSFLYDPEEIGFFLRRNAPPAFSEGDFQDIPQWRTINVEMLQMLSGTCDTVIVPMTLVSPQYFEEIVLRLRGEGIDVRHFILAASRETLLRRLRRRSLGWIRRERFATDAIERCIAAFDGVIPGERIETDTATPEEIVEAIAAACDLTLAPFLEHWLITLRHIR